MNLPEPVLFTVFFSFQSSTGPLGPLDISAPKERIKTLKMPGRRALEFL